MEKVIAQLLGGNKISFDPEICKAFVSIGAKNAAATTVFVCQLLNWQEFSDIKEKVVLDGLTYVAKSPAQWYEATGLTADVLRGCRDKLNEKALVKQERKGVGGCIILHISLQNLVTFLSDYFQNNNNPTREKSKHIKDKKTLGKSQTSGLSLGLSQTSEVSLGLSQTSGGGTPLLCLFNNNSSTTTRTRERQPKPNFFSSSEQQKKERENFPVHNDFLECGEKFNISDFRQGVFEELDSPAWQGWQVSLKNYGVPLLEIDSPEKIKNLLDAFHADATTTGARYEGHRQYRQHFKNWVGRKQEIKSTPRVAQARNQQQPLRRGMMVPPIKSKIEINENETQIF